MMLKRASSGARKGVALLTALVVLAVAAALSVTVTVHELSTRKEIALGVEKAQARWLARGGMELAIAHLAAGTQDKTPKSLEIKGGKATITVTSVVSSRWQVETTGEFSRPDGRPARVTLKRTFAVKTTEGKILVSPAD
ncbi:MAG: hypothetical protein EXR99_03580 [Gemmataceae bacterium]|nr:hypothetical protein [Gemmataceae bacterium]